jgi:predicted transcriptional regulator
MLKDVLKEINESKVFSKTLISKNLNINEALVEDALNQLIRMGYIVEDIGLPTCQHKCSGCSTSNCSTTSLKTMNITDKGKKLLGNL